MNEQYTEKQFETTEKRLDDHAERIRNLEKSTAVTDARLLNLCQTIEKQTRSINYLIGTFITALVGIVVYAVESGVFK